MGRIGRISKYDVEIATDDELALAVTMINIEISKREAKEEG